MSPLRRRGDRYVPPSKDYLELEAKVRGVAEKMQDLVTDLSRLVASDDQEDRSGTSDDG